MRTRKLVFKAFVLFFLPAQNRDRLQKFVIRDSVDILKIEKNHWYHSLKYRSRTEIVAMILEAANGGATKTKIMYKAFLSYAQLREYLSVLIENGLLEYMEGTQAYKTTAKGLNFLKMHSEIGELLQTAVRER
jgi:predicted transcriptional regulator